MDFSQLIYSLLSIVLLHQVLGQDGEAEASMFSVKIIPEMADQMVERGTRRVYTCMYSSVDSSQKPVLHWEVNDVRVTATSTDARVRIESLGENLRIRIENVQSGDEGTYKCVGTLGTQTDSRSVRQEVYDKIVIDSPEQQYGIKGQTGIVMCNATGNPTPTITWKFENSTNIEDGEKYTIQGIQLVIKDLQFSDGVKYLCDATVIQTGNIELLPITYNVIEIPVIDTEPDIDPISPRVGDNVTVTCRAQGVPEPTFEFRKSNGLLLPNVHVDKTTGVMTISGLKEDDEGEFFCVATNRGGSAEKRFFIDVKIPPTILPMDDKTDTIEASQLSLTCLAVGDPSPVVTWQKEGQDVYEDDITEDGIEMISVTRDDEPNQPTGKTLSFASVKPSDAGAYICTAVNDFGSSSKTINLEIKYKPHFNTYYKVTDFYGWEGHNANLTCLASSNEVATIKWYKVSNEGVEITTDGPYILNPPQKWPALFLSSSSLMINVGGDDSVYGDYQCKAENSLGSAEHTVTLIEAVTPQAPRVTVTNTWSTMVKLEVEVPNENGGQPITGYHLKYHEINNTDDVQEKYEEFTSEIMSVDLRNLDAKTSYEATVQAQNVVGRGTEFSFTFETKEVSQPLKLNITSPRVGPKPNSFQVVWGEPDDGGSEITLYKIKYREVSVLNEEADEWQINDSIDNDNTKEVELKDSEAREYTIPDLERNKFYEIKIIAINKEGSSDEEIKIIRTSEESSLQSGHPAIGDDRKKEENGEDENEDIDYNQEGRDNDILDEKKKEDGNTGLTLGRESASSKSGIRLCLAFQLLQPSF